MTNVNLAKRLTIDTAAAEVVSTADTLQAALTAFRAAYQRFTELTDESSKPIRRRRLTPAHIAAMQRGARLYWKAYRKRQRRAVGQAFTHAAVRS